MTTLPDVDKLLFQPPEPGCVLYMPGLPGGSNKLYDRSPYGNIGTTTGATWKRLPSGLWYLSFDGTDDFVDCGNNESFNLTDVFTIELWIKLGAVDQSPADAAIVARYLGGGDGDRQFLFGYNTAGANRGFILYVVSTANGLTPVSKVDWSPDLNWHYLVAIYNGAGGTMRIYLDTALHVEKTSGVPSSLKNTTTPALWLGKHTGGNHINGDVSMVRIHHRALTLLDMQNRFNREKQLFGVW